jgi:hypothetical protein
MGKVGYRQLDMSERKQVPASYVERMRLAALRAEITCDLEVAHHQRTGFSRDGEGVSDVVTMAMSDEHRVHPVEVLGLHDGKLIAGEKWIDDQAVRPAFDFPTRVSMECEPHHRRIPLA